MRAYHCDVCKTFSGEGWGFREISAIGPTCELDLKPVEHVCGDCWKIMRTAALEAKSA